MNLHDWIDELCDALDIETEVDEGLILDLAGAAARGVEKTAAPLTSYLLGFAAASHDAGPAEIEELAARAQLLADRWDQPTRAEADELVPDDSGVDHTGDSFED